MENKKYNFLVAADGSLMEHDKQIWYITILYIMLNIILLLHHAQDGNLVKFGQMLFNNLLYFVQIT